MGRGRGPADVMLPPIEKALANEVRQKSSKTTSTSLPPIPLAFAEGDVSSRHRNQPSARLRSTAEAHSPEAASPSPQPPPQPPKGRARPHPYLMDASLKGFCWRTSFEKIRPSAAIADKVYYAPVVPGVPPPRKGRRPRRQNGGMLPLQTYTLQRPAVPNPMAPRGKVLSALRTALAAEGLDEEVAGRVIGAVDEVMQEAEEEPSKPLQEPSSEVEEPSPRTTKPAVEDDVAQEEPPQQPFAKTETVTEVVVEPSTRPPSDAFLAALEDAPAGEFAECFMEALTAQATAAPQPASPSEAAPEKPGAALDAVKQRMEARLLQASEDGTLPEAEPAEEPGADLDEVRLRIETRLLEAVDNGSLQADVMQVEEKEEAVLTVAAVEAALDDDIFDSADAVWTTEMISDDEFEAVDDVAQEVLTSVISFAFEPEEEKDEQVGEAMHCLAGGSQLEFRASANMWVRRGAA